MKSAISLVLILITLNVFSQDLLKVGDKAPSFTAKTADGSTWKSQDHVGENFVVVYFYPAAMTGGCTKQACSYRDLKTEIESQDATVVGISGDDAENLQIFRDAYDLNFTLLSDESGDIARKFGVPVSKGGTVTKEVEGKNYELQRDVTTSRWTFIIDKDGKVVYKNEDVDVTDDSQQVLDFLKNNS